MTKLDRYRMDLSDLLGVTLASVEHAPGDNGRSATNDRVFFRAVDGRCWTMQHEQHCCEFVRLQDVVGDLSDPVGSPILDAREETNQDPVAGADYQPESHTWTFYILRTTKGSVTLRWLGESNGYYSESVGLSQSEDFKPEILEVLDAFQIDGDQNTKARAEAAIAKEVSRRAVRDVKARGMVRHGARPGPLDAFVEHSAQRIVDAEG